MVQVGTGKYHERYTDRARWGLREGRERPILARDRSVSLSHFKEIAGIEMDSKRPTLCSLLSLHILGEFITRQIKLWYISLCAPGQPSLLSKEKSN